jgi:hypothetical protein
MTTVHETSTFNAEASMNRWLTDGLADITKPSWLPAYTIALNMPQGGITPPCFSAIHLPVSRRSRWQGDHVCDGKTGRRAAALMDVSLWLSRQNAAYMAQAMAMIARVPKPAPAAPVQAAPDPEPPAADEDDLQF